MVRGLLTAAMLIIAVGTLSAQTDEAATIGTSTIEYTYTPIAQTSNTQSSIERFGLRLLDYLNYDPSDPRRTKFNIVGGPAYSENTGWRLAATANLYYHTKSSSTPQRLTLYAMGSLKGCYAVELEGLNLLANGRHTLRYAVSTAAEPTRIYGLRHEASLADRYGEYRSTRYEAVIKYSYRIASHLHIGIHADYRDERTTRYDDFALQILDSQPSHYSGAGIGVSLGYDTRRTEDINLTRGILFDIDYTLRPAVLGTFGQTLHRATLTFDYYQPLWRGGLAALDIYGEYHSDNTPWMLRSQLGGNDRMRGYYYGRFNGNTLITAQLELRQRVWEGLVVAGWGGCGTAFSADDSVTWRMALPTYGVGLRWYFSPSSLIRIDYGFGKQCSAFVVGYSEAF